MDKVFIYPNPTRNNVIEALPEILDYVLSESFSVTMEDRYSELFAREYPIVSFLSTEDAISACDFVLVVGGDGTILHISSLAARHGKAVLGINLGTMGFLSEIDLTELDLLDRLKREDFQMDERIMLDVTAFSRTGAPYFSAIGLNDAVIMKGDISRTARLSISINDDKVMGFSGDGVVICTPTGSTAYSLSAGGPILEPSSKCLAVTPICPHAMGIKSFVLAADKEIEVTIPIQDNSIQMSVDGYQNTRLEHGEYVKIKRAGHTLTLIRLKGIVFYERINQKLIDERL